MGYFVKNNDFVDSALFTGFVLGRGYNPELLAQNGDKDVIAVLYNEFVEIMKKLKEK